MNSLCELQQRQVFFVTLLIVCRVLFLLKKPFGAFLQEYKYGTIRGSLS